VHASVANSSFSNVLLSPGWPVQFSRQAMITVSSNTCVAKRQKNMVMETCTLDLIFVGLLLLTETYSKEFGNKFKTLTCGHYVS
jgi:hypothetical protein